MEKAKSKNIAYFVNSAIAIAIMVLFRFLPTFGQMTPLGMTILGIFLGLIYAWATVDIIWPAIVGLTFLGFSGYVESGGVATIVSAIAGNAVVQMLLWLFAFAGVIEATGLGGQLAKRIVASKLGKGHPWALSVLIFLAAGVVAALGNGVAAIALGWAFIYSISEQAGFTVKDKWPRFMVVGVIVAVLAGVGCMPFQAGIVGSYGYLYTASEGAYTSFNSFGFMICGLIYIAILTVLYFVFMKFIIRPDMSGLMEVDTSSIEIEPFTTAQKIAAGAFIALVVVVVLPSVLPDGNSLKVMLNTIGVAGLTLLIMAVMAFLRDKEGKPIISVPELITKGVPWPAIFLTGTAVYTGGALASQGTGFTATLLGFFTPLLGGMNGIVFTIFAVIITLVITQVLANTVACAMLVPVLYPLMVATGADPMLTCTLMIIIVNCGIMLPSACPTAAICWGNSEWVKAKDIWCYGGLGILAVLIAVLCLIPFVTLLMC